MRTRPASLFLLALLALSGSSAGAAPAVCDGASAVTLFGLDTSTGRMLFSVPPAGGGNPWLVEVDAAGAQARAHADSPQGIYGGSTGPGPVLADVPARATVAGVPARVIGA